MSNDDQPKIFWVRPSDRDVDPYDTGYCKVRRPTTGNGRGNSTDEELRKRGYYQAVDISVYNAVAQQRDQLLSEVERHMQVDYGSQKWKEAQAEVDRLKRIGSDYLDAWRSCDEVRNRIRNLILEQDRVRGYPTGVEWIKLVEAVKGIG